jgi:hypothetical protein
MALETLTANASGAFATSGHYGAVTASNARWAVTERCDGTLTRDTGGSVVVRDASRPRLTILHAGQSYLAKPKAKSANTHHRAG